MEHEILYRPAHSLARVMLGDGEAITAQAGVMVGMSPWIEIETGVHGGLLSGLRRAIFGRQSFFLNTFKATKAGEIMLAPPCLGDIVHVALNGEAMLIAAGSYLASPPETSIDTNWGGFKGLFSKIGLFLLKVQGVGGVFISGYGALHEVSLQTGENYIIDTGYLVAFDESVEYTIAPVGGLKTTLLSGEGIVCRMTGPGRVFLQSRRAQKKAKASGQKPSFFSPSGGTSSRGRTGGSR